MELCCHPYTVIDIHTGDHICTVCGIVLSERLMYENHSVVDVKCETEKFLHDSCKSHIRTKIGDDHVIKNQNVLMKWTTILNEHAMNFSQRVIEKVNVILSELVISGMYNNVTGTNRRGVVAVCLYLACKSYSEQCSFTALLSSFNIKSSHFFRGRRFLYGCNQNNPSCSWFFE